MVQLRSCPYLSKFKECLLLKAIQQILIGMVAIYLKIVQFLLLITSITSGFLLSNPVFLFLLLTSLKSWVLGERLSSFSFYKWRARDTVSLSNVLKINHTFINKHESQTQMCELSPKLCTTLHSPVSSENKTWIESPSLASGFWYEDQVSKTVSIWKRKITIQQVVDGLIWTGKSRSILWWFNCWFRQEVDLGSTTNILAV